jgi:hypothetical protein
VKNKIEDLRNHLFATLEALLDKDKPLEIERAAAIAKTAQVIVNSAKVEVDYLRVTGDRSGTGFIALEDKSQIPGTVKKPRLVNGRDTRE